LTKPDPELYLRALECLGVPAAEAFALEDSPNGARAATAAGLFCVVVPNPLTAKATFDRVDLRLNSLDELTLVELIARVEKLRLGDV
jgi:beta-phosphoglucomutase-like phosphatase (HAD superfamily)